MYNRVGKCGSRTTLELLKVLADRNDFVLATSDINNQKAITVQEQVRLRVWGWMSVNDESSLD